MFLPIDLDNHDKIHMERISNFLFNLLCHRAQYKGYDTSLREEVRQYSIILQTNAWLQVLQNAKAEGFPCGLKTLWYSFLCFMEVFEQTCSKWCSG